MRFAPVSGRPPQIEDQIRFGPDGDLEVVNGVGRFVRILRIGRIRAPANPFELYRNLERAGSLIRCCAGTVVRLRVCRRLERVLTVWTEEGVDRIAHVLDFAEEDDALAIQRRGGQSVLRIPRASLIRYESSSSERLEIVAIEPP